MPYTQESLAKYGARELKNIFNAIAAHKSALPKYKNIKLAKDEREDEIIAKKRDDLLLGDKSEGYKKLSLKKKNEYVIDKITYQETDGEPSPQDSTYLTGSVYNDNTEILSLSTIIVGETKLHMDYSMIRFDPVQNQFGGTNWQTEYYYFVQGQRTAYDLGNIVFNCESTRRIWKILDDSNESLTVRTSGQWFNGTRKSVVYSLTRIGP
jgi:hypothetical protein